MRLLNVMWYRRSHGLSLPFAVSQPRKRAGDAPQASTALASNRTAGGGSASGMLGLVVIVAGWAVPQGCVTPTGPGPALAAREEARDLKVVTGRRAHRVACFMAVGFRSSRPGTRQQLPCPSQARGQAAHQQRNGNDFANKPCRPPDPSGS